MTKLKQVKIKVGESVFSFVPTRMVGVSHVIYCKGTPGPVGWLPEGTPVSENAARVAQEGGFFV